MTYEDLYRTEVRVNKAITADMYDLANKYNEANRQIASLKLQCAEAKRIIKNYELELKNILK